MATILTPEEAIRAICDDYGAVEDPAPVNVIYPAPEPIPETEEERKVRMWRAVTDFARST